MLTALVLVATLAATPLEDQPEAPRPDHGVELGVRAGYSLPFGSAVSGVALSDLTAHAIPFQLDAGYRISQRWFAGVFFQYGLAKVKGCPPGGSCSGFDLRVAAQAQYHLLDQTHLLDPWVGLGVGYEVFQTTLETGTGVIATTDAHGLDFAELNAGFDYRLADAVAVGPWVNLSMGQFTSYHEESVGGKALHLWLSLGVRFVFDLF